MTLHGRWRRKEGGGVVEEREGVSVSLLLSVWSSLFDKYGNIVNNKEIRYYVSNALRHSYLVSANGVPAGVV